MNLDESNPVEPIADASVEASLSSTAETSGNKTGAVEGSQPLLYLMLVATMLLWGGTWPAGRVVASTVSPWNAAFIRFFIASVPLILVCLRLEGRQTFALTRSQLFRLALLGFTGIFGYSTFFFMGLKTTDAGRAALIVGSIPACIAVTSAIVTGERMRWFGIVGIITALCGVGTVLSRGSPMRLFAGDLQVGDVLVLGCVVCWTGYTLIGKPLMNELPPLVVVTWACILGAAILAPFAASADLPQALAAMDAKRWGCLIYLALFGTSLAYFWYYHALNRLGPMRTGIFINLVPIFGFALGCVTLGEKPSFSLVAGGGLVIFGVSLTIRAGKANAKALGEST